MRNLEALQILNWYQTEVLETPITTWTPLHEGQSVYAVGRGLGQSPVVVVYDALSGEEVNQFYAFDTTFTGGVRVAVAAGDGGVPDVIAAAGPGGGPVVRVFSGIDGSVRASFFAFDPGFRNGVSSIATADFDGDGRSEIVVGAAAGGGPVVAAFHGGDYSLIEQFYAYDPTFRGGVTVSTGVFSELGRAIITVPGPGGGPVAELFAYGATNPMLSFFVGDSTDRNQLAITAADLKGTGFDQLIVGAMSGAPVIHVYNPVTGANLGNFYAGPASSTGGVRLGVLRGAADELLVGSGRGGIGYVLGFVGFTGAWAQLDDDEPPFPYEVYVG